MVRARHLLRTGKSNEGVAILQDSLEVYRKLASDFPQTPAYRLFQAKTSNFLAAEALRNGSIENAGDLASNSLRLIDDLIIDQGSIAEYLPVRIEALAVLVSSSKENSESKREQLSTACRELEKINPNHPSLDSQLLQQSR